VQQNIFTYLSKIRSQQCGWHRMLAKITVHVFQTSFYHQQRMKKHFAVTILWPFTIPWTLFVCYLRPSLTVDLIPSSPCFCLLTLELLFSQ